MSTSPPEQPAFAELLRSLRVRGRLTQESLAERAGMTSRSVSNLERGRVRGPRPATAEALAGALRLDGAEREAFLQLAAREYWSDRDAEDGTGEDAVPAPDVPAQAVPIPAVPAPAADAPTGPAPSYSAVPAAAAVTPSPTWLAAERLAAETLGLWRREAADRGLTDPRPIDVRWHWHRTSLVGPDGPGHAPAPGFAPSSGRGGDGPLPDGGSVGDLYAELLGALPHRRLVIMGPAGSGKTGALVLLLLAALEHRLSLPPEQRWWLPVPVWVRAADWRPGEALAKLIRRSLLRDHGYLWHETYGPDAVSELLAQGRLLVLLDGLDELHHEDVADAVADLDRDASGLPLVVSCRPGPWLSRPARLPHAAIIELDAVRAEEARAYLLGGRGPTDDRDAWARALGAPGAADPADPAADPPSDPDSEPDPDPDAGGDTFADGEAAEEILTRPLTLALLRREITLPGSRPAPGTAEDQRVTLFEGLLARAYPDPGRRRRAVRRLEWLARRGSPQGLVHWWALPYPLHPLVQRLALASGLALAAAPLLLPTVGLRRGAVLVAVVFVSFLLVWGTLVGKGVKELPDGRRRKRYVLAASYRPEEYLPDVRFVGFTLDRPGWRVRFGRSIWDRDFHGVLFLQGGGEPAVADFSLRRSLAGPSGLGLLTGLVVLPAVPSTAARVVMVAVTLARTVAYRGLQPSLRSPSYDPQATFRADLLRAAADMTGAAVVLLVVATQVSSLSVCAVGVAALSLTLLGLGPSLSVWPALVLLACRGVWLLPPVRVLERDRAAGLLRRVGTAYEFRHEELREALKAGRIRA